MVLKASAGLHEALWLLRVGPDKCEAEQLEAVLWEAAKAGDMAFVQMVLRAANDWHQAYLNEAIKEAVQGREMAFIISKHTDSLCFWPDA